MLGFSHCCNLLCRSCSLNETVVDKALLQPSPKKYSQLSGGSSKKLYTCYSEYKNVIFLANFNTDILEIPKTLFCESYNLKCITKQPAGFKNLKKFSYFSLILTNRLRSFQSICVIETGLSYFQKLTVCLLKINFKKLQLELVNQSNFSKYDNAKFINSFNELLNEHEHLLNELDCVL